MLLYWMSNPPRINRRQFAENLVAATSAGALFFASVQQVYAEDKPAEDKTAPDSPEDAKAQPEPPMPAQEPAYPSEEVLLLTCLIQRYPSKHFDNAALQGIHRDLRGDRARSRILSQFLLQNSDEPGSVFQVLPLQR